MSWSDILIILACLFGGYWLVSRLMGTSSTDERATESSAEQRQREYLTRQEQERLEAERVARARQADELRRRKQDDEQARQQRDRKNQQRQNEGQSQAPSTPAKDDRPWYIVLGVSQQASREQIVAAYKRNISQYHPDKVTKMGADIRALAEKRSKEINGAYEAAMKLRA